MVHSPGATDFDSNSYRLHYALKVPVYHGPSQFSWLCSGLVNHWNGHIMIVKRGSRLVECLLTVNFLRECGII